MNRFSGDVPIFWRDLEYEIVQRLDDRGWVTHSCDALCLSAAGCPTEGLRVGGRGFNLGKSLLWFRRCSPPLDRGSVFFKETEFREMTHQWHDTYHHAKTPAHHLDPRSKLLCGLLFVVVVLSTPRIGTLQTFGFVALLVMSFLFAHVSFRPLVQRLLSILPFALLTALSAALSHLSLDHFQQVMTKALLSIGVMTVVSLTTPFPDLLRALEKFRLPKVLLLFLAFLYRYGAVLRKEAIQLERGWSARYFGGRWLQQWQRLGHILAGLLVRSYERAERVYAAMLARGFGGEMSSVRVLHWTGSDAIFLVASVSLLAGVRWGVHG